MGFFCVLLGDWKHLVLEGMDIHIRDHNKSVDLIAMKKYVFLIQDKTSD